MSDSPFEINPKSLAQTGAHTLVSESYPRLPTAKERMRHDAAETAKSSIEAYSARLAFLGATGQLHIDMDRIQSKLAEGESLSKQVNARIDQIKANGWVFEKNNRNYKPDRNTLGLHEADLKRISYSTQEHLAKQVFAIQSDALGHSAATVAHEVAHGHKGPIGGWFLEQQRLLDEAHSVMVEMKVSQELGVPMPYAERALKNGNLGIHIKDNWNIGITQITPSYANKEVSDFLSTSYGPNLTDSSTGKIKSFDLDRGVLPIKHASSINNEALALRRAELIPQRLGGPLVEHYLVDTQSAGARAVAHSLKGATAIGAFIALNGPVSSWRGGKESLLSQSESIAASWGGMEAASALGRSMRLPGLIIFGLGVGGANLADRWVLPKLKTAN